MHVRRLLLEQCPVALEVSRIAGEVFLWAELYGVDEYACHDYIGKLPRSSYKRQMAFVQIAHGGDKAYLFPFFPEGVGDFLHLFDSAMIFMA